MKNPITPIKWERLFQTPTYPELEKMSDDELIEKQNKLVSIIISDKDVEKCVRETRNFMTPHLPDILSRIYVPESVIRDYNEDITTKNFIHTRSTAIMRIIIHTLTLQVMETSWRIFNKTHTVVDFVLQLSPDCHIHYRSAYPYPDITVY